MYAVPRPNKARYAPAAVVAAQASFVTLLRHSATLIMVLVLLPSCAAKSKVVVMPGYDDSSSHPGSLAVAPFPAVILNKGDVTDDLGPGDPSCVLRAFMMPQFAAALQKHSRFSSVIADTAQDRWHPATEPEGSVSLKPETLSLHGDSILIWVPADGQRLECGDVKPDWILFISLMIVRRERTYIPGSSNGVTYTPGTYQESLALETGFALWDNTHGRLAAYGRASSNAGILLRMSRRTWEQGVAGLAENLMSKTPFYRRAVS